MAYAAAKLSELQNCASTLSNLVHTIMAIVDRHGLPLSVSTHAANHHEVRLVQLCFDFYMIEAKPENLIGDRAYDSDPLDDELRNDGIEMIAPHRSNRSKPPTQNRRRLSRYMRRWMKPDSCLWSLHQGIDRQGGIFYGPQPPYWASCGDLQPSGPQRSRQYWRVFRPAGMPATSILRREVV